MVVTAAAGVLCVGAPANAAVRRDSPPSRDSSPNTTTATATCGNGLIVLGPIIVPAAPNTTTVIQCQDAPSVGSPAW
jgi:hypothetical protein